MTVCVLLSCTAALAEEGEKKEIDTLRIGVAAMPPTMDPTLNVGNATIRVHYNMFETLIQADENNNYAHKPMLATEWNRIDDYTIEFKLREGVKWHNGAEMTAEDVKYSFDRLKKGITGSELAASLMNTIDHVDVIDPYTCRIVTNTVDPAAGNPSWLPAGAPGSCLPAILRKWATISSRCSPSEPAPTSWFPSLLKRSFWSGLKIIGVKSPLPRMVEYILYSETSTRMTALMTGEVDIITQLPMEQISSVEAAPGPDGGQYSYHQYAPCSVLH